MSLKVSNLSKRYADRWALRDVSFEIADGEVFGIFGPAGSGKTTLLRIIDGSLEHNGGSVFRQESDITSLSRAARNFYFVEPVEPSIWQRIRKTRKDVSDSEAAVQALKRAVASAKNVVIFDDPFCAMDAGQRRESAKAIRNIASRKNLPILVASNKFEPILLTCDRAAIIVDGEIKQIDTPQAIYDKPDSRAVAAVVGRNNLFAARRLTSSKTEIPEFHTIDGDHRLFAQRTDRGALGALNQNITLAIRPEHISISFGASFPEDNLLRATITRIQFLGPTTLLDLDANGLNLQALVLRLVGLNIGDQCMVGLPPDRIQVFRD